jgi:hypothetical protein
MDHRREPGVPRHLRGEELEHGLVGGAGHHRPGQGGQHLAPLVRRQEVDLRHPARGIGQAGVEETQEVTDGAFAARRVEDVGREVERQGGAAPLVEVVNGEEQALRIGG